MPPPRPTLRTGEPVWLPPRAAHRAPRYPRLTGVHRADVAIVGGGITGAIAALRFAEAGVDAVVLEADRIGHGSTAASSALLLQEPDARLSALSERYGQATARRIWRLSHDAARDLIALLERLSTPAAISRRDTIYYTTDADDVAPLHREYVARCRAGFDATWLTPRALRVDAGIPARAGIRTRGSAQCDPFRACEGVIARGGARRRARVRANRRCGGSSRGEAGAGSARPRPHRRRCRRGAAGGDRDRLRDAPVPAARRPLPARAHLRRGDAAARRAARARDRPRRRPAVGHAAPVPLRALDRRPSPAARRRRSADPRAVRAAAARLSTAVAGIRGHFERLLPALGDVAIADAWEGRFANTPDSLPYVGPHRRYPGHAFALGYGGNGMTFGSLAGRLLVEQWQGVASKDHALFTFDR